MNNSTLNNNNNQNYSEEDSININSHNSQHKNLFFQKKTIIFYKFIFFIISLLYILSIVLILRKLNKYRIKYNDNNINKNSDNINKKSNIHLSINEPFLPENEKEIINKKYFKSYYNDTNNRYHLNELFLNRKIFKINYSYLPYNNIDKSKSYEDNANNIYETTGMLNITKLDIAYYNKNGLNISNYNNIHLSMGHDSNYILLSLVSISSILNTTNSDTFIHFHIVLLGCKYEDMKPIISLKHICNNVEFIFYDGKQAEYDFGTFGKMEGRGIGDYTKFLIPQIVNNTNKIIF